MLKFEITGNTERIIREHAQAQGVTYASMLHAMILHGTWPDRGPTVTRPFGADGGGDETQECVRVEEGVGET